MKTLENLFLEQLSDMYDAEHRLAKALPKLAKAAVHEGLREAFEGHLGETQGHADRLEEVFETIGKSAKAKRCEAIIGLLKEGEEILTEHKGSPSLDAALICAAQKVEHYEIATYGCLREWADALGNSAAQELLGQILEEEKAANDRLTDLACEVCNQEAQETEMEPKPRGSSRLTRVG